MTQVLIAMVIVWLLVTFIVAIYFTIQLFKLNWHLEKNHPVVCEKVRIKYFLWFRGEDLPFSGNWIKEVLFTFLPDKLDDKYFHKLKTRTKSSFLLFIGLMIVLFLI